MHQSVAPDCGVNWCIRKDTVKASDFGPHGYFGPFFRRAWYYRNASYRKMNGIKIVNKRSTLQILLILFILAQNSPEEATNLARTCPKFPPSPKLEALQYFLYDVFE
jgi:hypothetical protein